MSLYVTEVSQTSAPLHLAVTEVGVDLEAAPTRLYVTEVGIDVPEPVDPVTADATIFLETGNGLLPVWHFYEDGT